MSTVTDLASYQQFAQEQQAQNNAWSAQQAQKQMDFQREMSNTAHQREVADLKAAGLNPILSVNSGASVPNGAQGETDTSTAGNVGAILQQVLSAQSAREVAGMYNAATIAAAQIAANASMYGYDVQAETQREYPNSVAGIASRAIRQLQTQVSPALRNISQSYTNSTQQSWQRITSSSWYRNLSRTNQLKFKTFYDKYGKALNILGSGFTVTGIGNLFSKWLRRNKF